MAMFGQETIPKPCSRKITFPWGGFIMKKYRLSDETITVFSDGHEVILHRLIALRPFSVADFEVHKGDLGGWIESEKNLSQTGHAWVCDSAKVYGNARVSGNAYIYGNVDIFGQARISGKATVYGNGRIFGNARISGRTIVSCSEVSGDARISGKAWAVGKAKLSGSARISQHAQVFGKAEVCGNERLSGHEQRGE